MTSVISPGTERAFILNLDNANTVYPYQLGYSAAGIVEKAGKNVSRFKVGDRVASYGLKHRTVGNIIQDRVTHIPDGVSFEDAAFIALGVISLQGIRKARIELGESVMVLGLGPIGQLALQYASISGALPAIGVDRRRSVLGWGKLWQHKSYK
jgi:NADPH:quinone reductase-like Zn-dependent oxidoreductase